MSVDELATRKIQIKIIGVGGGGVNTVNHIVNGLGSNKLVSDHTDIEIWAVSRDRQKLASSSAKTLQIDKNDTMGIN